MQASPVPVPWYCWRVLRCRLFPEANRSDRFCLSYAWCARWNASGGFRFRAVGWEDSRAVSSSGWGRSTFESPDERCYCNWCSFLERRPISPCTRKLAGRLTNTGTLTGLSLATDLTHEGPRQPEIRSAADDKAEVSGSRFWPSYIAPGRRLWRVRPCAPVVRGHPASE